MDPDRPAPVAPRRPGLDAAALLLGLLLLGAAVYRALSQAITCDEALTWLWILARPDANPLVDGKANNHVLFTLLAWLPVRVFGPTEWALRLPTVLAFAVYLLFAWRLCRRLGRPVLALAAFACLTLNPYLLDFFVAARGYGVSLAASAWALFELARTAEGDEGAGRGRLARGGLALGVAAAAHLTFAVLAGSVLLGLAVVLALRARQPRERGGGWGRAAGGLAAAALPFAAVLGALQGPLLLRTDRAQFYGGFDGLRESATRLLARCFAHAQDPWQLGWPVPFAESAAHAIALGLGAAAWGAVALFAAARVVRALRDRGGRVRPPPVAALAFAASVPLVEAAVRVAPLLGFTFRHPDPRRALWVLPLVGLALADAAAAGLRGRGPARVLGAAATALLLAASVLFAAQWNTTYFADFRYDAGSEDLFWAIEEHRRERGLPVARVGVQFMLYEPAINFYRDKYAGRHSIAWVNPEFEPDPERYDYVVLAPEIDPERFGRIGTLVHRDEVSGTWLAALGEPRGDAVRAPAGGDSR